MSDLSVPLDEVLLCDGFRAAIVLGGISQRTLYSWTEPRGTLRCVRIGGKVWYRPSDLKEWVDSHQANPIPPRNRETPIIKKPKRGGDRRRKAETQAVAE